MSKLMLWDFSCPDCGCTFEEMVKPHVTSVPCLECPGSAFRQIPSPRLDPRLGLDPDGFPTMGDKWARTHRQAAKIENERAKEHGPD